MPKCLVERFNLDTLTYIAESKVENGKHYLGTLAGPAAEFTKPTRNGRKYNLQLWRNVESSEDFKEGMATLTILGETDHPDDRLETKIKEVAIVLRKWEIREQEGIVYCEFDILDTPNGRILKELLDYGCKIGVSSRGSGEEVMQNGETIIDPDTYFFICFDAVITPAVAKARPEIVEGCEKISADKSNLLVESIQKEISDASTPQELESIKSIISATGLHELESLKDSIDKKLESVGSGDNISSKLIKELGESASRIEELEAKVESLEKAHSADTIRIKKQRDLIKEMKSNSKDLRERLQDNLVHTSHLEGDILLMTEQSSEFDEALVSLRTENSKLKSENKTLKLKSAKLESSKSNESGKLKSMLSESQKKIDQNNKLYEKSRAENDNLRAKLTESSEIINNLKKSERSLNAKLKTSADQNATLLKENKAYKSRYIQMKSVQCGFSSDIVRAKLPENYSIADVDRVVTELSDKRDRINKMPVAIPVSSVSYKESTMPNFTDDETDQTVRFLEAYKRSNN